jgi:chromosome partitioning protein
LDDLNPAIREFHALVKARISKKKLTLVINCVNSNAEEKNTREYLTEAGYFVFSIALLDKVSYREAQNQGLSISEVKYLRLKEQVQLLVKAIKNYI